jgi:hypothetical protein
MTTETVLTEKERNAIQAFGRAVAQGRTAKDETARLKRETAAIQKLVKLLAGRDVSDEEAASLIRWW